MGNSNQVKTEDNLDESTCPTHPIPHLTSGLVYLARSKPFPWGGNDGTCPPPWILKLANFMGFYRVYLSFFTCFVVGKDFFNKKGTTSYICSVLLFLQ